MEHTQKQEDIVNFFLNKKILVSPDIFLSGAESQVTKNGDMFLLLKGDPLYLNKELLSILGKKASIEVNWLEFEKTRLLFEKRGEKKPHEKLLKYIESLVYEDKKEVKIINSYGEVSVKREVSDFTMYFNSRLEALQKILYTREELKGATSIVRILSKKERGNAALIGLVKEKQVTKNNNIILTLEDSTGEIKVLVNKNKQELYDNAKDIVLDEVIGVAGVNGEKIVFANNLFWPEIPVSNELKKTEKEGYALFLSDLHVGSNNFLEEDFGRFINWINQRTGNEKQREIASKVKYIFIVGDLVDGVGVYPGQEEDLSIKDINQQYEACAELLSKIPNHINIIICAGNHDSLRMAEPQPPFYDDFCKKLHELPNVVIVSNPALINIHSSEKFDGYNVLMYHGYSFDYYVANVDSIRNGGGYDRADLVMKFLLQRRHLAPTHTSTLYVPYPDKDPLVIDNVPDFFVTGHIHKSAVTNYKNVTLISGSCWQSKTDFQEKVGHHPEPSRVPIVDLVTRQIKILRFGK